MNSKPIYWLVLDLTEWIPPEHRRTVGHGFLSRESPLSTIGYQLNRWFSYADEHSDRRALIICSKDAGSIPHRIADPRYIRYARVPEDEPDVGAWKCLQLMELADPPRHVGVRIYWGWRYGPYSQGPAVEVLKTAARMIGLEVV